MRTGRSYWSELVSRGVRFTTTTATTANPYPTHTESGPAYSHTRAPDTHGDSNTAYTDPGPAYADTHPPDTHGDPYTAPTDPGK